VHLAEGRHEPALTLLADAVEGAQRYGVDAVLAECLEGLSHVHEARDEFADALHCMRAARAAEGRHRRDVESARATLLNNCGSARREEMRLIGEITELLGNAGAGISGLDADTGPLPVTIVVESLTPDVSEVQVSETNVVEVADEAQVAAVHSDSAETRTPTAADISLASTTVPERLIEQADTALGAESSGGLDSWQSRARHRRGAAGTPVSVSDLLSSSALSAMRSGRRHAEESVGDRTAEADTVEVPQRADSDSKDGSAHSPDRSSDSAVTYPVLVPPRADPSEASRAAKVADATEAATTGAAAEKDTDKDTEQLPATRREFPSFGPPPAPTPRALEWEAVDGEPPEKGETRQMGLGDLLAEALAAYQESRDVHADVRPTAPSRPDDSLAAEETMRDLPHYGAGGRRWAAGLALAPTAGDPTPSEPNPSEPSSRQPDQAEASEAMTNPLLRLPDLSTEPRWAPPESGRRSAAGD